MTKYQQELYEKLLKKVNEYCLGAAAEDVIQAIDNLVDEYEYPIDRSNTTKDVFKALQVIYNSQDIMGGHDDFWEAYRIVETALKALENYRNRMKEWQSGHSVDFSKVRFEVQNLLPDLNDIGKKLQALKIIKEYFYKKDIHACLSLDGCISQHTHPKEYELLKEVLK